MGRGGRVHAVKGGVRREGEGVTGGEGVRGGRGRVSETACGVLLLSSLARGTSVSQPDRQPTCPLHLALPHLPSQHLNLLITIPSQAHMLASSRPGGSWPGHGQ